MSSTGGSDEAANRPALDRWPTFRLDHAVELGEGVPRCTVYPSNAPDGGTAGAWITARGDAFVDVHEVR